MNQQPDEESEVTERLEFLLATRIRYELHQRAPSSPAPRASEPDAEAGSDDPVRELRVAEFLLATRLLREANERALRQGDGAAAGMPDAPPR